MSMTICETITNIAKSWKELGITEDDTKKYCLGILAGATHAICALTPHENEYTESVWSCNYRDVETIVRKAYTESEDE